MMKKYVLAFCIVAVISASVAYFVRSRSVPEPEGFPYVLSAPEIESLKAKSTNGDCEASTRLAKYYLYGALDLDTAIKWLRVAARCPDVEPKAYLVEILAHNQSDPESAKEVARLVSEIRAIDPDRAAKLEGRLKELAEQASETGPR